MSVLNNLKKLLPSRFTLFLILIISFTFFQLLLSHYFPIISYAWSATYYVDATSGNNGNSGLSIETPWQSIAKVNTVQFRPGDQILFKRGNLWREQLNIPSSGALGNLITFGAYDSGNDPIINGADVVTGVSLKSGGANTTIYQTSCTWEPTTVLQDSAFLTPVSWNTDITTTALVMSTGTWTIDTTNQLLYIWCTDGAAPSTHTIEASRRTPINGNAMNYIGIDHLTVKNAIYAGLDTNGGNNWYVTNVTAHHNADYGLKASGNSDSCTFEDSTSHDNGARGFAGGIGANYASNLTVRRCASYNNNFAQDMDGMQFNHVTGLLVEHSDIYNNHNITGTSSDNMQINHTTGAIIRYNHFHGGCNSNCIFTGRNSNGSVYYNIIEDGVNGININDAAETQTDNINIYNNITYGVTHYPLHIHTTGSGIITAKNNIFHGAIHAIYVESGVSAASIALDYNRYFNDSGNPFYWAGTAYATIDLYRAAAGQDTHSTYGDPIFISTSTPDFHLKSGSPVIRAGVNVGLTTDYAGNPVPGVPDIGAYEFVTPTITPPTDVRLRYDP